MPLHLDLPVRHALQQRCRGRDHPQPSLERARALLKEAGYDNERVVIMQPADSALINPMAWW